MDTVRFEDVIKNSPSVNSEGYFKELMESINQYINGEYEEGRLTGTEYATVYLGAMQTAMAQAFQFELQQGLQQAQIELVKAQKLQAETETIRLQSLTLNVEAERLNIPKQGLMIDAQTALTNKKSITEDKQQLVLNQQANLYDTQAIAFEKRHSKDVAKMTLDAWSLQRAQEIEILNPSTEQIFDQNLKNLIEQSKW